MNITNVKSELASALGDPNHTTYNDAALQSAILRAVCAYSQYKPCLRRMGVAQLVTTANTGSTEILCTGGILSIGQQLTLGYGLPSSEVVTIADLEVDDPETFPTAYNQVTLTSATVNKHFYNELMQPVTNLPGLAIVSGIDTYFLPLDFVNVEQSSFDIAVGAKLCYRKQNGFYDATAIYSNQLSGTGFGRSMNWGPNTNLDYPLVGNIYNNPNAGVTMPLSNGYRFYLSDAPYLRVFPVPTGSANLDFDYYGCQTIPSAPSSDQELIILYATWAAASAYAKTINTEGGGDLKIEDYETKISGNVKALNEIAQQAYSKWEDKMRFIPYCVSG